MSYSVFLSVYYIPPLQSLSSCSLCYPTAKETTHQCNKTSDTGTQGVKTTKTTTVVATCTCYTDNGSTVTVLTTRESSCTSCCIKMSNVSHLYVHMVTVIGLL